VVEPEQPLGLEAVGHRDQQRGGVLGIDLGGEQALLLVAADVGDDGAEDLLVPLLEELSGLALLLGGLR